MKFFYLALGGSIGAILRYLVSLYSVKYLAWGFPVGTLAVNMLGSFFIGLVFVLLGRDQITFNLRIFLFIGLFGSFTTFSTFMFESYDLFRSGMVKMAFLYISVSNIFGLLFVYAGFAIGEFFEKQLNL